jgi:hypothetical protein
MIIDVRAFQDMQTARVTKIVLLTSTSVLHRRALGTAPALMASTCSHATVRWDGVAVHVEPILTTAHLHHVLMGQLVQTQSTHTLASVREAGMERPAATPSTRARHRRTIVTQMRCARTRDQASTVAIVLVGTLATAQVVQTLTNAHRSRAEMAPLALMHSWDTCAPALLALMALTAR